MDHIVGTKTTPDQIHRLGGILSRYKTQLQKEAKGPQVVLVEYTINTSTKQPIHQPPYRVPLHKQHIIEEQIKKMLDDGIIRPSKSPWSAPVVLAPKADGQTRFCVNYKKLNDITIKDAYPLHRIDDTLQALGNAQIFSSLDLRAGYWQIPMREQDIEKTAFIMHEGLYEFVSMPFGLANAPATFQRLMNAVLRRFRKRGILVHLDDIIIFSTSLEDHWRLLEDVLDELTRARLTLNLSKCAFICSEMIYLGHHIGGGTVKMNSLKVEAILALKSPVNISQVRTFLGMSGYYRRFVQGYARIADPLLKLTRGPMTFTWGSEQQESFEELKKQLAKQVVLYQDDPSLPFILDVDASDFALGAVLSQKTTEGERVVGFAGCSPGTAGRKRSTTEKEALAIIWGIEHLINIL